MPWRPVLLPQERTAHLSSTLKTLSWRAAWAGGTDRGRPHYLCSTGNGMWGGSQQASKQASKQASCVGLLSAARSLAVSAPAMLTAASCGAGAIETAVTSATEAAVVVVVVHIWMKIGTGPVEHLCPRHASHIYGGRGDALGAPLDPRGPQRRRHHLRSCTGAFHVRAATSAPCRGAPCACLCELREQLRPQTDALSASRAPPEPR